MPDGLKYSRHLAKTSPYPIDLPIEKAKGSYLYSPEGKSYLDLIAGIAVASVGHNHPHVTRRIKKQLDLHSHVMVYGEYPQAIQNDFAEEVIKLLGDPFEQLFLTNSGTEANEGAIKLAKRYTGRSEIISFHNSYHGSTHGSLSVSGNESRKSAFRPLIPEIEFIAFNNVGDLDHITGKTAAVIIEPIQGDAGVRIASQEFLEALRSKCNETGAILIFDEVQTGFGRTGKWFAFQHYGLAPDIITMGKAMGAGLPVAGFAATEEIMSALTVDPPLGHITTYGGNPICCASGMGAIEVIQQENLLDEVERKGELFETLLEHEDIKDIRRKGLMLAVDLESPERVERVVSKCREYGTLIYFFLSTKYSFRISPPLTITDEEIKKGCDHIVKALVDTA